MNVIVICGHRGEREQNEAFAVGKSQLKWPRSKHNLKPSRAMDVCPAPIDWNNTPAFREMCLRIERIAKALGIRVRLGRDFSFSDWPHVELA
ncbi:MAG: M15 family metallopeptidase [Bdellovibrionaceae bacterium]|nr:M15 family metallopeptidase [Pseudobdellovibrionaceae bacterium]